MFQRVFESMGVKGRSGFFNHKGIPGHQGGSLPRGASGDALSQPKTVTVRFGKSTTGERSQKAKQSHKPVTASKQKIAYFWEQEVARMIGGEHMSAIHRKAAFDVRKGRHYIEVRTIHPDKTEPKFSMHYDSGKEKDDIVFAGGGRLRGWVVAVDLRGGYDKPVFYVRRAVYDGPRWAKDAQGRALVKPSGNPVKIEGWGFGNWYLNTMKRVTRSQLARKFG